VILVLVSFITIGSLLNASNIGRNWFKTNQFVDEVAYARAFRLSFTFFNRGNESFWEMHKTRYFIVGKGEWWGFGN
jgi:hypothetical protein